MRSLLKAALSLGLLTLVACTAIVTSDDPVQCNNDGDCTKRGPDFVDSMCSNGLCVAKPPTVSTTDSGASSSGVIKPNAECTKNADCASKGDKFVCSSNIGKCAPTESEDCKVVYGDPTVEGTVLYGLMSEIATTDTQYFRQVQHRIGAKLAFEEFFDTAGVKFPGERRGALIACDEHFPRRAAALLANAGVKAVLGPAAEDRQRPVVETLLPARIPSFTPWINGNPASVVEGSNGFAWLAGFERRDVLPPLNALVAEKEKALRDGGKTQIRVAVVLSVQSPDVPPGFNAYTDYGLILDQLLEFNGKTAIQNTNDSSCKGNACYKVFQTNQAELTAVAQRAKEIVAFEPDLIIPFSDIDWGAQLLPALETEYGTLPANARPTYVHPFLQIEDSGYKSLDLSDASLRARISGIRAIRDNSFELFSQKFKAALTTPASVGTDPNPGAGRAFETSLLLLLASYAGFQANAEATPEQIVAALPKVTDTTGPRITLTQLVEGVSALNQNKPINFDGLFSFFEFDQTSHTAPATWTTWCATATRQYDSSANRVFKDGKFSGTGGPCP